MTEQEKEDQLFEERGGMIVGEDTPLWIKIFGWIVYPPVWLYYKFKK